MSNTGTQPAVPDSVRSDSRWKRTEETAETVFSLPNVEVTGHTVVYEDADLRERIVAAGGPDRIWRFVFATQLEFSPSLPFGTTSLVKPRIVTESKREFAEELRERGFEAVEVGDTESVRTDNRKRARLTRYRAQLTLDGETLPVAGRVAAWYDGAFYVAGGAYPTDGLDRWVNDAETERYEKELLDIIRAVG
ncbi:hypothetical protein KY092_12925 [Natronomonas gomsonensis]|jgi:hypothetical protein|uniref:hypothetical protein n=1 Tax=Natronomonas gomsonensis TaxID=1046043 RepID=UPI0020CA778F|nr:hypothetical protein [Natronomonas gomsonensis]MCY4731456.1 hypothetical protein [Natronomonas gomsonensis]